MTRRAPLVFDPTPHGYVTHERCDGCPCPGAFACGCTTSLEERFRARSIAEYEALEAGLQAMTKPQLRAFILAAGSYPHGARGDKDGLVLQAFCAQWAVWWPAQTVQR